MIQDFKFAFRQLLKSPGFTAVAVLTLALAIGVNSAIFALINGVVLHPVVPERPNEVVNVFSARQNASHDYRQFSYSEYRELRENGGDVFADFAGSTLQINGQPYTVIGIAADGFSGANALIAPDIWAPIGVRSQLGSAFGDSETMHDLMNPENYAFNLTGRMRPGLTIDMAKSRLPVLAQRLT